jgi:hypothetical protein
LHARTSGSPWKCLITVAGETSDPSREKTGGQTTVFDIEVRYEITQL